jgi:hypothetical protein
MSIPTSAPRGVTRDRKNPEKAPTSWFWSVRSGGQGILSCTVTRSGTHPVHAEAPAGPPEPERVDHGR